MRTANGSIPQLAEGAVLETVQCRIVADWSYMKDKCELCGSEEDELNFHHLIPRTLHSNKYFKKKYDKEYMKTHGADLCKWACHRQIHRFISEKDMGLTYNTIEKLLEHEEVKKYIDWRKKRL